MITGLVDVELDCFCNTGQRIKAPRISPEFRIVDDAPDVAFECRMIGDIEPSERGEQSNVRLGQPIAKKPALG